MSAVELAPIRIEEAKAIESIRATAGERELARLEGILTATPPPKAVVKSLEALQLPDGGFAPAEEAGGGGVLATCSLLAQLHDLPPLAGSPMASRALAFLRRNQGTDGSWHEQGADPLLLTAGATYTLLTMEPEHNDPIARADGWLRRHLAEQPEAAPTRALAWGWAIWYRLVGPAAQETRAAFAVLQQRLGDDTALPADVPDLAHLLDCALAAGAGGPYLLPLVSRLSRLAALQQADGSWPGDSLETTLTALRVFRGYGVV